MKKRTLTALLALSMLLSLALGGCGSDPAPQTAKPTTPASDSADPGGTGAALGDSVTFKINNTVSGVGTLQDQAIDEIIQKLSERSGGRIQGTKVAGGVLGGEREVTEAIQLNTLEMALISDMGIDSAVGGLSWAWMPFMITNYEDADQYYNNGWIGEELGKQMEAAGVIRLAATENDFRLVGNTKHPITSMDDFKGLKVRTPEIKEVLRFYELCGALPVGIATSEVLTALEQGTIDGVDNTVYNHSVLGVLDSLPYITKTNYMYNSGSIVCSKPFWDSLSAEDQALFREVSQEAGENFRTNWRAESQKLLDDGVANGTLEVTELTDEMYEAMKEIASQLWDEFGEKYDPELVTRVREQFGV